MPLTPGCIDSCSFASDEHQGYSTPSTASDASSQDLSFGHMDEEDTCNSMIPSASLKNDAKMQSEQILAGCDAPLLPTLLLGLWQETGDNCKVLQSPRCWDSKAFRPLPGLSDPEPHRDLDSKAFRPPPGLSEPEPQRDLDSKAFSPPPGLSEPEPQRECASSRPQQKMCPAKSTSISVASRLPSDICKRKESSFTKNRMHKTSGGSHSNDDRCWRLVNRKITDPQRPAHDSKCAEEPCRDSKRWCLVNRRIPGPQLVTVSKSFFL